MSSRGFVAIALGVLLVVGATILVGVRGSPARVQSDYLALGDSISYGLRESGTLPTPVYSDPASFTGFPEDVAAALGMQVANAACPGETSLQLLRTDASVLGCRLHVPYTGTQINYATTYLKSHPATTLVTLMIGINDTLKCQASSTDDCTSRVPRILAQLSFDVATTLKELRTSYTGTIVIVNYYPLVHAGVDYSSSVNRTVDTAASPYRVKVADGWRAFESAAAGTRGNLCAAGLLTRLVAGGCGIHPSLSGQSLLALAVEEAVQNYRPPAGSRPPPCVSGSAPGAQMCNPGRTVR